MDYERIKAEMKEIVAICNDIPEPFRGRCFELMLERLLRSPERKGDRQKQDGNPERNQKLEEDEQRDDSKEPRSLPGAVKAFIRKHNIKPEELNALFMIEDGEFHFLREPAHSTVSRGQNELALLIALRNALTGKEFIVDPEEVRSTAQDKGFYDKANFSTNFKKDRYAVYYKGPMEPQGAAQGLSKEGETALVALIKSLATQTQ